jgi:hypothetical protein
MNVNFKGTLYKSINPDTYFDWTKAVCYYDPSDPNLMEFKAIQVRENVCFSLPDGRLKIAQAGDYILFSEGKISHIAGHYFNKNYLPLTQGKRKISLQKGSSDETPIISPHGFYGQSRDEGDYGALGPGGIY